MGHGCHDCGVPNGCGCESRYPLNDRSALAMIKARTPVTPIKFIVIHAAVGRDPRRIRLAVKLTSGVAAPCPLEVATTDTLGVESWRSASQSDHGFVTPPDLLARALAFALGRDLTGRGNALNPDENGIVKIDLGRLYP